MNQIPYEIQFVLSTIATLKLPRQRSNNAAAILPLLVGMSQAVSRIYATVQEAGDFLCEKILRATPLFHLNLHDAVVILHNFSLSLSKEKLLYSNSDSESVIGRKVRTAILALSEPARRNYIHDRMETSRASPNHKAPASKNKKYRSVGRAPHCRRYGCGSKSDSGRSDECQSPYFITKEPKYQSLSAASWFANT